MLWYNAMQSSELECEGLATKSQLSCRIREWLESTSVKGAHCQSTDQLRGRIDQENVRHGLG